MITNNDSNGSVRKNEEYPNLCFFCWLGNCCFKPSKFPGTLFSDVFENGASLRSNGLSVIISHEKLPFYGYPMVFLFLDRPE